MTSFGVATASPQLFGKMLRRAPFMFNIDPPSVFDCDPINIVSEATHTTSNGFFAYNALAVLQEVSKFQLRDMDKIIRSDPKILMVESTEVAKRLSFLLGIYSELEFRGNMKTRSGLSKEARTTRSTFVSASAPVGTSDEVASLLDTSCDESKAMLKGTLESFPNTLSIPQSSMQAVFSSLRSSGIRRDDIVFLVRRIPQILGMDPLSLRSLIAFLREECGLRKSDLAQFLITNPSFLTKDLHDLRNNLDYLFNSLGGTPTLLRGYPQYLLVDFSGHLEPRVEFLIALGVDPLLNGLPFLIQARDSDLARLAGVKVDFFEKFRIKWRELYLEKADQIVS